jgi:hypothetical protein
VIPRRSPIRAGGELGDDLPRPAGHGAGGTEGRGDAWGVDLEQAMDTGLHDPCVDRALAGDLADTVGRLIDAREGGQPVHVGIVHTRYPLADRAPVSGCTRPWGSACLRLCLLDDPTAEALVPKVEDEGLARG